MTVVVMVVAVVVSSALAELRLQTAEHVARRQMQAVYADDKRILLHELQAGDQLPVEPEDRAGDLPDTEGGECRWAC